MKDSSTASTVATRSGHWRWSWHCCCTQGKEGGGRQCRHCCIVDGPLVPLHPGDYVDIAGQYWMEPDIGMASEAFRACLENPERTGAIALAGQRQIAENHTIFSIAVRYLHRLKALGIN